MTNASQIDKAAVRHAAMRAAAGYAKSAYIESQLSERLIERLDEVSQEAARLLDLGCGPGVLLDSLRARFKSSQIMLMDASVPMLRQVRSLGWRKRRALRVSGDLEALPLRDNSIDLVVSGLALPWVDPAVTLADISRVLTPDGLLLFTSYGPDTLSQLRAAWAKVDSEPHVHTFLDMHDVGDALLKAGFRDPVMDVDRFTVTYTDPYQLFCDLRASGSTNALCHRRKTLTGKARWQAMLQSLEGSRIDGQIEMSCEVIFGHAWGAPAGQPSYTDSGAEVSFSVDDLRNTLPSRRPKP